MNRTNSENTSSSPIVGLMFDGFGLEGDGMGQVAQSSLAGYKIRKTEVFISERSA
jgi:hypothetical protein